MFNQLKQLAQLKKIKDAMERKRYEEEKQGVKVIVNGKMEVEEIILNPDLDNIQQAKVLKECVNAVFMKIQKDVAGQMFAGQM